MPPRKGTPWSEKRRAAFTQEVRDRMSRANRGRVPWNKGERLVGASTLVPEQTLVTLPDLDALEQAVDAMRHAGVSGVTISVDDAAALIADSRALAAAQAECERLRDALRYYANEDGWTYTTVYQQSGYSSSTKHRAIDADDVDENGAGKRARTALAQKPEARR